MKIWLFFVIAFVGFILADAPVAADASLRLQPLQYEETLQKGERKKGYVDVTNPLPKTAKVKFSVEGFRQYDDRGSLTFFQDEQIAKGVLLDYDTYEIPAKKTFRLFFIIDGTKLPTGDVFAAIFAQTVSDAEVSVSPSVRIGTLLLLTNGTPSARQAEVTALQSPWLQTGSTLDGTVKVKNNAPVGSSSGFFPTITINLWPFGPTTSVKGPLVFAGNTRQIAFHEPINQLGIYKITASYGDSHKDRWIVLVTGVWRWILLYVMVLIIITAVGYILWRRYRKNKRR